MKSINFIEKSIKIHGNKYDYSKVEYINNKIKVKIICPEHGEFEQMPDKHINRSHGCPNCSLRNKLTTPIFISEAIKIHGNKYDYSKVQYNNIKTNVIIICPEHGEFTQQAASHIRQKTGCPKCSKKYNYSDDEFKMITSLLHNNKYDYSKVEYINNYTKIKIICPEHGEFEQTPSNHLQGKGCELCNESKGENIIKLWLEKNNISYIRQHRFIDCVYKRKLPFDFYLPEHNICIEFNGKQHYEPIKYWGGEDGLKSQQKRDKIKINYCKNKNIKVLTIKYNEDIVGKLSIIV